MRRTPTLALAVLLTLGLAACGGDDEPAADADTSEEDAGGGTITMKDFAFSPDELTASVGDTIAVENADSTVHTLTAEDDSFDTGRVDGGDETSIELTEEGDVAFVCQIHPAMKGVIHVEA